MNQSLSFDISGMTCGGCSASVQRALSKIEGISRVQISLDPPGAKVVADTNYVTREQIESAVAVLGYSAKLRYEARDSLAER
jgi:copper chaperone